MTNKRKSFSMLVPLGALLCSVVLPVFFALRAYFRLKIAAHGAATVSFGSVPYRFTIPTDHLFSLTFWMTTHWLAEGPIRAIHAPAAVLDLLVSMLAAAVNWQPGFFLPPTWVIIFFPLFALPAWWFVGRGFDGLLNQTRIRVVEMIVSAVLIIVFLGLAGMIRFGFSAAERGGRPEWYMYGFAFWGVIASAPLFAWIRQRTLPEQTTER